ncbi:hypothetical protein DFJ74DRAFT_671701 [Hyaloraphidium curvatum]|nr:hypothetical protein DFJ74DRAFT_671701 [Hyaloraphidium curvatum]
MLSLPMEGPSTSSLQPEEWAVVHPMPSPVTRDLAAAVTLFDRDPGKHARDSAPFDVPSFTKALEDAGAPLLGALIRLRAALWPILCKPHLRHAAVLPGVALCLIWMGLHVSMPPFSAVALVLGSLAVVGEVSHQMLLYLSMPRMLKSWRGTTMTANVQPMAPYVRWRKLTSSKGEREEDESVSDGARVDIDIGGQKEPSVLVEHDPLDKLCPCAKASCAGGLLKADAWARAGDALFYVGRSSLELTLALWTPMLTMANLFFRSWGSAAFVLVVAGWFLGNLLTALWRCTFINTHPSLNFRLRVQHRVVSAALRSMLSRYRSFLLDGQGVPPCTDASTELYRQLNAAFAADLLSRFTYTAIMQQNLLVAFVVQVIAAVLNFAAGPCFTLWQLVAAVGMLATAALELSYLAASNDQINDTMKLYSDARTAARSLALDAEAAPPDPLPTGWPASLAALKNHAELLDSFMALGHARVALLGFPIGYGTARAVVATGITVGFALTGALRGAGVHFTVQSVCPSSS